MSKTNENKKNVTINFKTIASDIETLMQTCDTKKTLVTKWLNCGLYTSTIATDTVNKNDLYIQLNTTDKPRLWFQKNGFKLQYDSNAKRENKNDIYENIAKKLKFKFFDTPSYRTNRTSDKLSYSILEKVLTELQNNSILALVEK